jgi:hypothetical protein
MQEGISTVAGLRPGQSRSTKPKRSKLNNPASSGPSDSRPKKTAGSRLIISRADPAVSTYLGGFVWSSQRPAPTGDETNQEKNQKNNKKDPGDLGRRPGYAGQAQKAGNQTDD